MGRPKKLLNKTGELGRTGLPVYAGRIYNEPLAKLAGNGWRKAIRDMTANDPTIGAMLFGIEMLARQVTWKIVPFSDSHEDQQNAQFARECIFEDMTQNWQDTVAEILSKLQWGWSWFEMCFKDRRGESRDKTKNSRYDDGKTGFRKWAIRGQESLYEWKFDEFDEVDAMVQLPAPDFKRRIIPFETSLHFRTTSHMQNPEGRSILRSAYRPWFFKSNIENIEGIGIERDLAGFPVVDAPPEYFSRNATPEQQQMLGYLQGLVQSIRRDEMEGAVIPCEFDEHGNRVFDLRLLASSGKRQFDTSATIDRWDQRIAICVLADFLFLGSKSTGSYALMDGKTGIFSNALSAWLDSICDTINRRAIPKLMKLNGKPSANSPYITHGKVQKITLPELGEYVGKLSGANISFTAEQEDFLKRQADIPVKDE